MGIVAGAEGMLSDVVNVYSIPNEGTLNHLAAFATTIAGVVQALQSMKYEE
ncbi:MAG: hypothetical protein MUP09_03820 [Thiovulaceae bacterium]|nr:hypothetical protein [Sulfurimonadaceae bacterium]